MWPYPLAETRDGYLDYVYYGPTVLPIRLTLAGEAASINASVIMGICSDICVPATASFSLAVDPSSPDRGQGLRIDQAAGLCADALGGGDAPVGEVWWDASANALAVALTEAQLDVPSIIATAPTPISSSARRKKARNPALFSCRFWEKMTPRVWKVRPSRSFS